MRLFWKKHHSSFAMIFITPGRSLSFFAQQTKSNASKTREETVGYNQSFSNMCEHDRRSIIWPQSALKTNGEEQLRTIEKESDTA